MLFNSPQYLAFFLTVLTASWLLIRWQAVRIFVLLAASYYFYAANNHWLIVLLFISTTFDYVAGIMIARSPAEFRRKLFLILSLCCNLGMLAIFKYANFFGTSLTQCADLFGAEPTWVDLNIALPVGISFYTFQSMSYTIDVYRGKIPTEYSFKRFAFFVAFFPQLVAGPIVRAAYFLPQTHRSPSIDARALNESLENIFKGIFKKIVLADFLAIYAEQAFNNPGGGDAIAAWLGVYAFTFQIYFDFSGYSDIAIGCSRLLGYELPRNFRRPYVATSITDFWSRWHISLSTWLRDYLYISLGGNRMRSKLGVYRNLMITMLLGGLWHGAAWHFVLWGFVHGLFLSIEKVFGVRKSEPVRVRTSAGSLLRRMLVFHLVAMTWLIFRCENMFALREMIGQMLQFSGYMTVSVGTVLVAGLIFGAWFCQCLSEQIDVEGWFLSLPAPVRGFAYGLVVLAIISFGGEQAQPFIYFRF